MIYIIHQHNTVKQVLDNNFNELNGQCDGNIVETLFSIAHKFHEQLLIWCNVSYKNHINEQAIPHIFHHKKIMTSFSVSGEHFLPEALGYVDRSIFINVKNHVLYPTWLMSSDIGGIHASVLNTIVHVVKHHKNFDYFLNSLAKQAMPKGLFCYSAPQLLKGKPTTIVEKQPMPYMQLFKFVRQHYKLQWVYVLFFAIFLNERKCALIPLVSALFYKRNTGELDLSGMPIKSTKQVIDKRDIDVIIPTIGRKAYLYDVLKDLSKQTVLPKNVIIVEQNPNTASTTELTYLKDETWPFRLKHIFTHQTGACNARNVALDLVENEWVFLNDDDNRFDETLIENCFDTLAKYGITCLVSKYIQADETLREKFNVIHQTGIFGSGNCVLKTNTIKNIRFNMALEFGYGEDFDFGVQLRNDGTDVVFCPNIEIKHLKAPMGGFRTAYKHPWLHEAIQPKPSPTIMYNYKTHHTKNQVYSYKILLFLKLLKNESWYNLFPFVKAFNKRWKASEIWKERLG